MALAKHTVTQVSNSRSQSRLIQAVELAAGKELFYTPIGYHAVGNGFYTLASVMASQPR